MTDTKHYKNGKSQREYKCRSEQSSAEQDRKEKRSEAHRREDQERGEKTREEKIRDKDSIPNTKKTLSLEN